MSRKNLLSSLHSGPTQEHPPASPPPHARPHMDAPKAKPLAAVSKSLGELNDRSRRASEIERKLSEGQAVVELDTASIDPSFVQDRMDEDIDGLLASIREQGQQVPILVRLHPDRPGRYQVAFGHRRLRALAMLGVPVKAIVRDLTDEQLVIAQGQENNERKDLSFIERARFAARLREQFSREVIISSMSIDKGNLSKMLSIIDSIPEAAIVAIGAAPGVGSPNWLQMAELFNAASDPDQLIKFAQSRAIQTMPSTDRFKAVLALKTGPVRENVSDSLSTPDGERLAEIKQGKTKVSITIDRRAAPDFAAFVLERVPELYVEYRIDQQKKEA